MVSRGYAAPVGSYIAVSKSTPFFRKNGWFKNVCPACDGLMACSTWYGGWELCERCGGNGRVSRTWLFVVLGVVEVLMVVAKFDKNKCVPFEKNVGYVDCNE